MIFIKTEIHNNQTFFHKLVANEELRILLDWPLNYEYQFIVNIHAANVRSTGMVEQRAEGKQCRSETVGFEIANTVIKQIVKKWKRVDLADLTDFPGKIFEYIELRVVQADRFNNRLFD